VGRLWGRPIDLNRASVEELETLPGIGPARAADIVAWRERWGEFERVEQLGDVPGIGRKTLAGLRGLVTVD
jgi:competence protein ComEA